MFHMRRTVQSAIADMSARQIAYMAIYDGLLVLQDFYQSVTMLRLCFCYLCYPCVICDIGAPYSGG